MDDSQKWNDRDESTNGNVDRSVDVAMEADDTQARDEDGQLAGWLPALVLLSLILLSPFLYDAITALARLP